MKVVIVCEFSGIVRDEFVKLGCDAISIDLLPSEKPGNHYIGDARDFNYEGYDLAICHPPCTYLCVSGARWFSSRKKEQEDALDFVKFLFNIPVKRICIENPVSIISTKIRKPDQIIQPYMFGHGETKKTCLWLKNLPLLEATNIVDGRLDRVHKEPPSNDRWKNRSRTYTGIAKAMATQWITIKIKCQQ